MLILHVEDDPDIQEIARLALTVVGGHDLVQFSTGDAALNAAGDLAPDLVLLDMMMPEMTGAELMALLRHLPHYAKVPMVFMTARAQPHEVAQMRKLGAAGVVVKPFDPMTLADQLVAIRDDAAMPATESRNGNLP
ncbi:response regulator [Paracoccus sp. p3-h83]|uniref:response regulator n=1 Tax=Paracoccus sp. p3-h83 TaxID=3342805 RepID=UPI0035BA5ED0